MGYLVDSSALWRFLRDPAANDRWEPAAEEGLLRTCYPQRAEFLTSARNLKEYSDFCRMFSEVYLNASVPTSAEQWIERFQYRAAENGCHKSLSTVDLLICATAAHHGLMIVHDDTDFATAARLSPDVDQITVHEGPIDPRAASAYHKG